MRSLSVPAKLRPENAILPLLRRLFSLSPTDLCIIHLSLPAARSPFSGQAVKKSAVYWLHKGVDSYHWTSIMELAIKNRWSALILNFYEKPLILTNGQDCHCNA